MKRSEPMWKRELAKKLLQNDKDKVWNNLQGIHNGSQWTSVNIDFNDATWATEDLDFIRAGGWLTDVDE